jgi:hypothetical protein
MEDLGDMGDLFHHDCSGGFGLDGPLGPDSSMLLECGGHPNINSYHGGKLAETGITISDISMASSEMSFTVALEVDSS